MIKEELLLIPGPTPVTDEIYNALASETRGHTDPRFAAIYKNAIENTKKMFNTDGEVYVVAGSGTLAMEMALINTVAVGEKVLVVSHGYFGDRFIQLGQAFGIEVDVLQAEWGQHISIEEVDEKLTIGGYKAVTVTHADTSTGVAANLEELVPVVKKHGALFILDGVCATAAMEEDMSKNYGNPEYKIDVILTGAQKAIGVPPGLAIVAFNQTALLAREKLGRIPAYYVDINNWRPVMDNPTSYFATPPVNLIYAYDVSMKNIVAEGMEARIARHRTYGKAVRSALKVYGMTPLASEEAATPTLSCILYPEGINDAEFRTTLAEKGVIVAGSLAHLAGKAFRIGHMGNTTAEMLEEAIVKIGETLQKLGHEVDISEACTQLKETMQATY
ncbi:pyridoxal-phosphate-dependent aminotransferase family protein [Viridibacillus sp. NPDC096237]|uniref:pyridoxal-phosphate-dependent aminotransferase family protein n=1 Tax=Viridibacillus sp. NPDC096237 TaxID=3390721 RepID=UPI003D03D456